MQTRHVPIIDEMTRENDQSGVILSWFLRVGLFLVVIGVILFDIGSIVVNKVTLTSSAEEVAVSISLTLSDRPGDTIYADSIIYDMAVDVVEDEANGVSGARVLRKGTEMDDQRVVHVRLRRRSETLITDLISPLKKYTVATGDGQAGTN